MKARRKQPYPTRRAPDVHKRIDNIKASTLVSSERLGEWSLHLLERGLKAYEKIEKIHLELSRMLANSG